MTFAAPVVFDDWAYLSGNPLFAKPAAEVLAALFGRSYFAATREATWQPLANLLNWPMLPWPWLWRLTGVVLHAASALLLRGVARRLTKSEAASWAAAVLFLLFPFSSEVVFFASWRGHELAAVSSLACLLLWLDGKPRASAAALAVGLLGKESALVGPALVVLHWAVDGRRKPEAFVRSLRLHGAVAAAYALVRFGWVLPIEGAGGVRYSPLLALGWSLRAMLAPWPSCLFRSDAGPAWAAVAAVAAWAVACWAARGRKPVLFGLLWVPVALLPSLHLVPFARYSPVGDRFLYLSAGGFALAVGALLAETRARILLAVLAAFWGGALLKRNGAYRDAPQFAEDCALCAPDHPQALAFSAQMRLTAGDYSGARQRLEKAVALAPADPGFHDQLGLALYATGYKTEAATQFRLAAEGGPGAEPWNNLGAALAAVGSRDQAIAAYEEAVRRAPGWEKPRKSLAELKARKK